MTRHFLPLIFAFLLARTSVGADDWTKAVEVRHDVARCVSYRARISGPYLVVQATLEPGWHTFAMDNQVRAEEKLAGKRSLGIERATEIKAAAGLEVIGPWRQTPPREASRPELNWYSWIFEKEAQFAARVRRSGRGPARVIVRGQACTESICKNIDIEISLPRPGTGTAGSSAGRVVDLKTLQPVRPPPKS